MDTTELMLILNGLPIVSGFRGKEIIANFA